MNDNLYLDTPIDQLIKWVDEHAVATEDGEAGDLACDAYEEYLELRTNNDSLLEALRLCKATLREYADVMGNAGIDEELISPEAYIQATEAIRKTSGE